MPPHLAFNNNFKIQIVYVAMTGNLDLVPHTQRNPLSGKSKQQQKTLRSVLSPLQGKANLTSTSPMGIENISHQINRNK